MRHEGKLRDLAFLITGIGIGSAILLLLAPASGEDVRYALRYAYRKAAKKIGRRADELRDHADELLHHARRAKKRGARIVEMGHENIRRWA